MRWRGYHFEPEDRPSDRELMEEYMDRQAEMRLDLEWDAQPDYDTLMAMEDGGLREEDEEADNSVDDGPDPDLAYDVAREERLFGI